MRLISLEPAIVVYVSGLCLREGNVHAWLYATLQHASRSNSQIRVTFCIDPGQDDPEVYL